MQIGTQTNSFINHLYGRMTIGQPDPEVGMGATLLGWTDRDAATIHRVFKLGQAVAIEVSGDDARLTSGSPFSESQTYAYTSRPDAYRMTFRQAKDGAWHEVWFNVETKRWNRAEGGGRGLRIGERRHYRDPSF